MFPNDLLSGVVQMCGAAIVGPVIYEGIVYRPK